MDKIWSFAVLGQIPRSTSVLARCEILLGGGEEEEGSDLLSKEEKVLGLPEVRNTEDNTGGNEHINGEKGPGVRQRMPTKGCILFVLKE